MLIDVSRKPLIIYPDEAPQSVVVRSIGNRDVNGIVSYWIDAHHADRRRKDLTPGAQVARGSATLYETRIPLPGVVMPNSPYYSPHDANLRENRRYQARYSGIPEREPAKKVEILPEPFEVASAFSDLVTNSHGTWRTGIRIEYVEKMKRAPWVVSIVDVTSNATLSTIAVGGLVVKPETPDVLPLTRAIQKTSQGPANAWTRLLDDTDED
jgi:hypothetical protein